MKKINARKLVLPLIILMLFVTLGAAYGLLPYLDVPRPPSPSTGSANVAPVNTDGSIPLAESQSPALLSVADVVAKIKPSVVAINIEVTVPSFFGRTFTRKGSGSGWIIDKDGVIGTNAHVVDEAESITVTLDDGRSFPIDMSTVATDPQRDLAVLKIDAGDLPEADIGDSSALRVGDWVVAIGNSLGLGISATNGQG